MTSGGAGGAGDAGLAAGARRLLDALETRLPLRRAWRWLADEEVPGGARWAYVLGSAAALVVGLQIASGLLLALDYAPTTHSAHPSVARIMELPWGGFVRGLHHHGASLLIVVLALHLSQVAWSGAYKAPRELNWLTGLGLAGVVQGFAFTGYLLPWDQNAFYATRVGLNIMRGTPVVGPALATVLQGGDVLGNPTLTRFYALHVIALPAALVGLLVLHVALFRRHGVTPPARLAEAELAARARPFWPHQALRDLVIAFVVVGVLFVAAAAVPAPLGEPADPATPLDARPEWYFYWLFQLLHWFEPPLEWLATMGIPGLVIGYLALLPWIDRCPSRSPRARWRPLAGLAVIMAGIGALTAQVALREAAAAPEPAAVAEVQGGVRIPDRRAAILYGRHCARCHGVDGAPTGEVAEARDFRSPDFARMAASDFDALLGVVEYGGDKMPAFGDELTTDEMEAVLRQVVLPLSSTGGDARPAGEAGEAGED